MAGLHERPWGQHSTTTNEMVRSENSRFRSRTSAMPSSCQVGHTGSVLGGPGGPSPVVAKEKGGPHACRDPRNLSFLPLRHRPQLIARPLGHATAAHARRLTTVRRCQVPSAEPPVQEHRHQHAPAGHAAKSAPGAEVAPSEKRDVASPSRQHTSGTHAHQPRLGGALGLRLTGSEASGGAAPGPPRLPQPRLLSLRHRPQLIGRLLHNATEARARARCPGHVGLRRAAPPPPLGLRRRCPDSGFPEVPRRARRAEPPHPARRPARVRRDSRSRDCCRFGKGRNSSHDLCTAPPVSCRFGRRPSLLPLRRRPQLIAPALSGQASKSALATEVAPREERDDDSPSRQHTSGAVGRLDPLWRLRGVQRQLAGPHLARRTAATPAAASAPTATPRTTSVCTAPPKRARTLPRPLGPTPGTAAAPTRTHGEGQPLRQRPTDPFQTAPT